jgi:BirA family transcriptional regulator, biotin operon repressor / biotin---[acetyl-CoA-carboxylase] ligase
LVEGEIKSVIDNILRKTFIRHAKWHDQLDSTNSAALSLALSESFDLPAIIGTTRQTAGRGRGSNSWWSSDGALTFSILFNPLDHGLPFARWPQVALMTGLAVADVLESYLPPASVQLKWPNDVYADGRKICGILTEVPPGRTDRLVVGIGLNVGNSLAAAPTDIRSSAVSLVDLLGSEHPVLEEVLIALVHRWEGWLKRLATDDIDFPSAWRPKCYLTGERVSVTIGPESQTGMCIGLDRGGALLLETDRGVQRILAGTVRRL